MNDKLKVLFYCFIIVTALFLSYKLISEAQTFTCDMCTVTFEYERLHGEVGLGLLEVPALELERSFLNDSCPVRWSKTEGFIWNK